MKRLLLIWLVVLLPWVARAEVDPREAMVVAGTRQVAQLLSQSALARPSRAVLLAAAWRKMQPLLPQAGPPQSWEQLEARLVTGDLERSARLAEAAMRGMVDSLGDPYSTLLTPAQRQFEDQVRKTGSFTGIGVELAYRDGVVVVSCLEGSPAAESGLEASDRILAVDGKPVAGLSFYDAGNLLLGQAGSTVRLQVEREGRPLELKITRRQLQLPEVTYRMAGPGVGLVRIGYFGPQTAARVHGALKQLRARQAKALILDLRDNPGGDFEQGTKTAALFVTGPFLRVERVEGATQLSAPGQAFYPESVAVLINRGTASAAEIVALALHGRSGRRLFGERSFGKARIQTMYSLAGGGALNLSTGRYLDLQGRDIHGRGLDPDEATTDPVKAALAWLR
ncbi:MAG: S41 family peptidase [Candidatus Eremiobacteraeota bacterium]|nr:S41 family peptidase [Candidatus Eremiobacteraeota bacterium]